jgi:uncharacterized protein GlcG (DUF336 family)
MFHRAATLALAGCCAVASHPALADALIPTHRLPAMLANEAAATGVATCAGQGYAETVVVVDADGVRIALLRGDGAGAHSLDSAYDKAYTAASFKTDTTALVERAQKAPGLSALFTQVPHLMLFGGGAVIKVGDEVVGAVGAAGAPGADLDQGCAAAAVEKIRSRLVK